MSSQLIDAVNKGSCKTDVLFEKKIALEQTEAKIESHTAVRRYPHTCKENVDARGMLEAVKAGGEEKLSKAKADTP